MKRKIKLETETWSNNRCDEIEELINKHDSFNLCKKLKEAANIYKQCPISTTADTDNKILLKTLKTFKLGRIMFTTHSTMIDKNQQ